MEKKTLTWFLLLTFLCGDNGMLSIAQNTTQKTSVIHQIHHVYCAEDFECTSSCASFTKASRRCSCHPTCELFKDCCYNTKAFNDRCSTSNITRTTEVIMEIITEYHHYFQCVSDSVSKDSYWMVSKCPDSWKGQNQCEIEGDSTIVSELGESIASMPVVSNDGITFWNIYCALCHQVNLTTLTPWSFQAEKCRYDNKFLGDGANVTIQEQIQYLRQNCEEASFLPSPNHPFYPLSSIPCHQTSDDVIDTCEGSPLNDAVVGNCSAIHAPISMDGKKFKNKFCVECYYSSIATEEVRLRDACRSHRDRAASFDMKPPNPSLVPISITFDFGGQRGGFSITKEDIEVDNTSRTCDIGQVFDPLQSTCMHLLCPEGYELRGKFCVQNKRDMFNSSCSQFVVNITIQTKTDLLYFCSNYIGMTSTCLPEYVTDFLKEKAAEENISCFIHQDYRTFSLHAQTSSPQLIKNLLLFQNITNSKHPTGSRKFCEIFGVIEIFGSCVSGQNEFQPKCDPQWIDRNQWYLKENTDQLVLKESYEILSFSQIKFRRKFLFTSEAQFVMKENVYVQKCKVKRMCPYIILDASLFQPVGNGSRILVYVHNKSVQFSPDTYVQLENGSIQVCNFLQTTGTDEYVFLPRYSELATILSTIGISLSILALSFSLVTYGMFATLRTRIVNILIMNLCSCLIVAQLLLIFSGFATSLPPLCAVVAGIGHFSWLAAFSTSSVLGYALDQTFSLRNQTTRRKRPSPRKIMFYLLICFSGPTVVCGILLTLYLINGIPFGITYGTEYGCWIGGPHINLYAFGVPVAIYLLLNLVFFCHVTLSISHQTRSSARIRKGNEKYQIREFVIYVKIFVVLGLTWIVGFVASFTNVQLLWYIFIILTSLQGVFIFLAFTVKSQIWDLWKKRLGFSVDRNPGVSSTRDTEQLKRRTRASQITDTSTV